MLLHCRCNANKLAALPLVKTEQLNRLNRVKIDRPRVVARGRVDYRGGIARSGAARDGIAATQRALATRGRHAPRSRGAQHFLGALGLGELELRVPSERTPVEQRQQIRLESPRFDVSVGQRGDLRRGCDAGAGLVGLGDGDAAAQRVHRAIVLVDLGADGADRHRTGEAVRFFESGEISPTGHAEDPPAAAAVVTATAQREVGAAVEALWCVFVFYPHAVEGVGRTRLANTHIVDR